MKLSKLESYAKILRFLYASKHRGCTRREIRKATDDMINQNTLISLLNTWEEEGYLEKSYEEAKDVSINLCFYLLTSEGKKLFERTFDFNPIRRKRKLGPRPD